ncbi:MAG: hypothetical protein WCK47_05715 [bacterium]
MNKYAKSSDNATAICLTAGVIFIAALAQGTTGTLHSAYKGQGEEPTTVALGIFVLDIMQIDCAEQMFTADIYVEAHWYDPQLAHEGKPLFKPMDSIWHPQLQVLNQLSVVRTLPEHLQIMSDGLVILRQRVFGNFSQPLELRSFPFDQQVLSITFIASGLLTRNVQILPLTVDGVSRTAISRAFSLPDWDITNFHYTVGSRKFFDGSASMPIMIVNINVDRRQGYYILKVLIPLLLIVFISWITFWLAPDNVGVNISVPMTSMLTLVAYRFTIGGLLPRVSYFTRMDAFILSSMFLVFAVLVYVVAVASMVKHGHEAKALKMRWWGRMIFPLCIVVVVVWTLYFTF